MKFKFSLIIGVCILVLLSCEKDDNETPDVTAYSISDIAGTWSGNAQNANNDFSLTITIDSEGNASGTGAEGDVDISEATGALVNISGGESLTLDESRKIIETVAERLDDNAKIIWGAQVYKDLDKVIRTMLIVTGVSSEQIFGEDNKYFTQRREGMKSELGIEFMD